MTDARPRSAVSAPAAVIPCQRLTKDHVDESDNALYGGLCVNHSRFQQPGWGAAIVKVGICTEAVRHD
ncbi:hypothetical protein AB0E27_42200 [Streptomyces sparsogenes]|uniref:hypothetical protein n=1 Tax=Streptomyces sparsogenes TaxID=67365 RepID=UPI0033F688EC